MATKESIAAYQSGLFAEWNLKDDKLMFANAYVANGLDGKNAYLEIKPNVSPNAAAKQASKWLKNDDELRRYVEFLKAKAAMEAEVTAAEFLAKTRRFYAQCSGDVPVKETAFDSEGKEKVVERRVFNPGGAGKAIEMLGRYAGVFVERVEHTGADGAPIRTQTTFVGVDGNSAAKN